MKIILAPDSFKGTFSSREMIGILSRAARRYFPDCEIVEIPIADGGEGTLAALLELPGSREVTVEAYDPMGRPRKSRYGLLAEGTAVVEMAEASGLTLVPPVERDTLLASTYGTGQIILQALRDGCRDIVVTLGGSATNDGGIGCMRALGIRFLDRQGQELEALPRDLEHIVRIDRSGLEPLAAKARFRIMSDVRNPLLGPTGATMVFGPQKGADAQRRQLLETGMSVYADVLEKTTGRQIRGLPGAGAAGGLGAALMAFLDTEVCSGIGLMLEISRFADHLQGTDLVITGEGHCDGQSACGKVLDGIGRLCRAHDVPAVALVGGMGADASDIYARGISAVVPTINDAMPLEKAMERADELAGEAADRLFCLLRLGAEIEKKKGSC